MSSLRVINKRSKGKKYQEETEKKQYIIVTENNLFKGFTAESVRYYDNKYSGNLIVAPYGIPHSVEDSWPVDTQRHQPSLSSLLGYFRS